MSSRQQIRRDALASTMRHSRRDFRQMVRNPLDGEPLRWALRTLAMAATAGFMFAAAAYFVIMYAQGVHVPFWQLWTVLTALMLVLWTLNTVVVAPKPASSSEPVSWQPAPTAFVQASRWQFRLDATEQRPQQYATVVRDRIAEIVAARLRQHHGIALYAEPQRAREILDPQLHRFLTEPVSLPPDPAELHRLIGRIEEI